MSKVTPKEFKVGDEVSKKDIQDSFSAFKTTDGSFISHENIRESGLNDSFVAEFVNPSRHFSIETSTVSFSASAMSEDDRCKPTFRDASFTPYDGYIRFAAPVFLDVPLTTENDYAIVRMSCRMRMDDYGSRTFFSGRPPVIGGALYYAAYDFATPGVDLKVSLSSTAAVEATWRECIGTRQVFGRAFSGKIPAASMLEPHVWDDATYGHYTLGSKRPVTRERDDRFKGEDGSFRFRDQDNRNKVNLPYASAGTGDFVRQYDYRESNQMVFDYDFPYSAVHRHTYSTTPGGYAGNIRFVFLVSAFVPNHGFDEGFAEHSTRNHEARGCKMVEYPGFTLSEMSMTANVFRL